MELEKSLRLIPKDRIATGLRQFEDEVLDKVKGPGLPLVAAYRIIARQLSKTRRVPKYRNLPARLIDPNAAQLRRVKTRADTYMTPRRFRHGFIVPQHYVAIMRGIKRVLAEAAEMFVTLDLIPASCEEDPNDAIARRVQAYRKQNERIERRYGITADVVRVKPTARKVWCEEMRMGFPSARQAAEYLTRVTGRVVRRSDIRTAIRKGHRCGMWVLPKPDDGLEVDEVTRWNSEGGPDAPHRVDREMKLTWRYVTDLAVAA